MQQELLSIDGLDFGSAFSAIPNSTKFLAPISLAEEEPLQDPSTGNWLVKDGKSLQGQTGAVIFNPTDKCYQALLPGDFLLFNNPSREEADILYAEIFRSSSYEWELKELKKVLQVLVNQGFKDFYPVDYSYLQNVTPIYSATKYSQPLHKGGYVRKKANPVRVIFVEGNFVLTGGPANQVFEKGAYVIEDGGSRRGVQPDEFRKTYLRLRNEA